jgi:hypothetical protein
MDVALAIQAAHHRENLFGAAPDAGSATTVSCVDVQLKRKIQAIVEEESGLTPKVIPDDIP